MRRDSLEHPLPLFYSFRHQKLYSLASLYNSFGARPITREQRSTSPCRVGYGNRFVELRPGAGRRRTDLGWRRCPRRRRSCNQPARQQRLLWHIGSRAFAAERGGDIEIKGNAPTIKNGFFINTAALNTGDAGNVTVRVDTLTILDGRRSPRTSCILTETILFFSRQLTVKDSLTRVKSCHLS
jgi:hypothetical protein